MKKTTKRLTIILLSILLSIFMITVVYAESAKALKAWYGVKIMYNNQQLISNTEPFIVDGTTYVPLRMIMNTFEKDITWDSSSSTVNIFDKPSSTEIALRTQLLQKDATIADLQSKLKEYESDSDSSDSSTSISDLEDELNDDYEDYDSKDFNIRLSGDNDEISVRVDVSSSDWSDLSSSRRTSLIENISEDIKNEYEDAKISGYVRSSSGSSRLLTFYYASNNVVRSSTNADLIELEQQLDSEYFDYFEDEDIPLYITISGSTSSPTFKINIDYDRYDSEWDDLSDSTIKRLMSKIYDDIEDEYGSADIDGVVYDTGDSSNLATYYRSSSGTENFVRN